MFDTGAWVATRAIMETEKENPKFFHEIKEIIGRYVSKDWGDLDKEDKKMNDDAVENGNDRILAAYNTSEGRVWIITEWDRSVTTIMFANEY